MTSNKTGETAICQICKKHKKGNKLIPAGVVPESITEKIKAVFPDWSQHGYICLADLNRFRGEYVEEVIKQDKGELTALEAQVVDSLKSEELLTKNLNDEYELQVSLGGRLSDKIADFGGSWRFIGIFGAILLLWIIVNATFLIQKPFDPYPYIFLNLILSCLAAIQAPIIMMSQNRQEAKDRMRAEHDYQVNMKAELEIRHLHEKIDHLLMNQWQRLLEIQKIQTDLIEEVAEKSARS
jgi:uncharacterized membrane protein